MTERGRSQTVPSGSRTGRYTPRPFQAAPLVDLDDDGQEKQKKSKMRSFLRAIGLSCLFRGTRDDANGDSDGRSNRFSRRRQPAGSPALRAITLEDARYALLDSEDGSVYSSFYDGSSRGHRLPQSYVLFLGTEKPANYKPDLSRMGKSYTDAEFIQLKELRPSLQERQTPVFFTPPPPDIVAAVTPRRRSALLEMNTPTSYAPVPAFA